jgi:hypothetical protein
MIEPHPRGESLKGYYESFEYHNYYCFTLN